MRRIVRPIICAFLLHSSVWGQSNVPQAANPSDKATIYFYRVEETDRFDRVKPKLFHEGVELAKISESRYFAVRLRPGHHNLSMHENKAHISMLFEGGKTYYIRISRVRKGLDFKYDMILTAEDQALARIKTLRPLEDKHLKKGTEEIIKERPQGSAAQ